MGTCHTCRHYDTLESGQIGSILGDMQHLPPVQTALQSGELSGLCGLRRELTGAALTCEYHQGRTLYAVKRALGLSKSADKAVVQARQTLEAAKEAAAAERARKRLMDARTAPVAKACPHCQREHVECQLCKLRPASCGVCTACGSDVMVLKVNVELGGADHYEWACRKCPMRGIGLPAPVAYPDHGLCDGCAEIKGLRDRGVRVCEDCAVALGAREGWEPDGRGRCAECHVQDKPVGRAVVKAKSGPTAA